MLLFNRIITGRKETWQLLHKRQRCKVSPKMNRYIRVQLISKCCSIVNRESSLKSITLWRKHFPSAHSHCNCYLLGGSVTAAGSLRCTAMPSSASSARLLAPPANVITVLFSVSRPKLQGNAGGHLWAQRPTGSRRSSYRTCRCIPRANRQEVTTGVGQLKRGGQPPSWCLTAAAHGPPAGREEAVAAVRGQQANINDVQQVELHGKGGGRAGGCWWGIWGQARSAASA